MTPGKNPCFTRNLLFPVKNGDKNVRRPLTPAVSGAEILKLVQISPENLAIAINQPVTIDHMLQRRNGVVEFMPVARALELTELLADLIESPAIATVPV